MEDLVNPGNLMWEMDSLGSQKNDEAQVVPPALRTIRTTTPRITGLETLLLI